MPFASLMVCGLREEAWGVPDKACSELHLQKRRVAGTQETWG